MKKMIFAAMALTAILASCNKNHENTTVGTLKTDGPQVQITLGADNGTRAFFDDAAAAEAWESEIREMSIYVFNDTGEFLLRRSFTAAEIAAKKATFGLPNSVKNSTCQFYAIANHDPVTAATRDVLNDMLDGVLPAEYNSADDANLSGSARAGGFVMTGQVNERIGDAETTTVPITIKRNVAKIAVKATVLPEFAEKYNGASLVITGATISQANTRAYLMPQSTTKYAGVRTFTHTQATQSSDGFNNLFYICQTESTSVVSDRVTIELTGYMDLDGREVTTDDRVEAKYTISVEGAGTGMIHRNGYYRIDAKIKGLEGEGLIVDITVADWETPVTQQVELGN